jgi:nucleotide-binding universal stress UspA family protein
MKILMYYDGTTFAREAVPVVKQHAKAFSAHVAVVSSLPRGDESQREKIQTLEDDLALLKNSLEQEEISCETHLLIRGNDAGDDLVWFAHAHEVDEIIIGTEKKSRVEKFIMGSVAQDVIVNVQCPVVVI